MSKKTPEQWQDYRDRVSASARSLIGSELREAADHLQRGLRIIEVPNAEISTIHKDLLELADNIWPIPDPAEIIAQLRAAGWRLSPMDDRWRNPEFGGAYKLHNAWSRYLSDKEKQNG